MGPTIGRGFIETIVARTNALNPDLIVITGDLVDGTVEQLAQAIAPLGQLRPPRRLFRHRKPRILRRGRTLDPRADPPRDSLPAQRTGVDRRDGEASFDLAGVDDLSGRAPASRDMARIRKRRSGAAIRRERSSCWRINPGRSSPPLGSGWACRSPGTPTAASFGPSSISYACSSLFVAGLHRHAGTQVYVSRTATGAPDAPRGTGRDYAAGAQAWIGSAREQMKDVPAAGAARDVLWWNRRREPVVSGR